MGFWRSLDQVPKEDVSGKKFVGCGFVSFGSVGDFISQISDLLRILKIANSSLHFPPLAVRVAGSRMAAYISIKPGDLHRGQAASNDDDRCSVKFAESNDTNGAKVGMIVRVNFKLNRYDGAGPNHMSTPAVLSSHTPKLSKRRAVLHGGNLWSMSAVVTLSIKRDSVSIWLIGALALVISCVETHAQDLEPRAYANTPVGLNFLLGGYAYSKGTVGVDPSVPITDTEIELNSNVLAYVRTLDLWGRAGKVDLIIPYTWLNGRAKLAGQERERKVSGFGDPRLRFSILLYGAPALSLDEYRDYEPDVIVGTSLEVTPPLGQYESDKLVNIGTNRWSFKPEVGVSKTWGPLTLEFATGVRFYTDNNDFLDGKTLQVKPVYSVQGHLIYSVTPGIWLGFNSLYYGGGRAVTDGKRGERLENARVGVTLVLPVNRYNSVKLYGSTGVYSKTAGTFDIVGIVWQLRWGGGL